MSCSRRDFLARAASTACGACLAPPLAAMSSAQDRGPARDVPWLRDVLQPPAKVTIGNNTLTASEVDPETVEKVAKPLEAAVNETNGDDPTRTALRQVREGLREILTLLDRDGKKVV